MAALSFEEARECVLATAFAHRIQRATETVPLDAADGRVLAAGISADRDFPALSRSTRDGFAVRSSDTPARLKIAGEVRAGQRFADELRSGQAVEIMTGAPLPGGADAVVMIEHVERDSDWVTVPKAESGQFVNRGGSEAREGEILIAGGRRLAPAEIALAASAGAHSVQVFRRPRVAILSTGDEIVDVADVPAPHEIRNSNAHSLAAQVRRAGGLPFILPVARDDQDATAAFLGEAFERDLVLISGGVSAGKYDVVEPALASLGAEFYFDRVKIQPGQPLVFGRAAGRFFFGLPGNPISTMVTFELFARAALEILAGVSEPGLPLTAARLTHAFRHKPGLTRFLPAVLDAGGSITPVPWQGSSDIVTVTRGNAFLVAEADRENWSAGDWIRVLLR